MVRWKWYAGLTATVLLAAGLNSCGGGSGDFIEPDSQASAPPGTTPPGTPPPASRCAVARMATSDADLITGPLARSRVGDFVLENDRMRVIVQKPGRNWLGIAQFGGNIIDASPRRADGSLVNNDQFEEFILGTNVESSPNYQSVQVVQAGGEDAGGACQPAVIRAEGPDDLFEIVNASSIIRGVAVGGVPLQYPPSADDTDLPLTFQTDYTLQADQRYVRIDTTMINDTPNDVDLYLAEFISGSGELEIFQSGYGFGEPFVTAPCDSCRFAMHAGHDGGSGVSYGVIHDVAGSTNVSAVGVIVILYGRDVLDVVTTPEGAHPASPTASPNFTVPGNGSFTFTRWFAVGDGTVASVLESRNEILGLASGTLSGQVTDANGPVANAEIAVLNSSSDFPPARGPDFLVRNHFRTDAQGRYSGELPAGNYNLMLNVPGRLAGTPANPAVTVTAGQETVQDFTVPRRSAIRVMVRDASGTSVPAKVQLLGSENSPDAGEPLNSEVVLGALEVRSGVYGDENADPLPSDIVLAEFAVNDPGNGVVTVGDTGELPVEPGDYILSVSRGMRFSEFTQNVTVVEGQTLTVNAVVAEVVPIPNHLAGDFHVHSFQSLDAEVTDRERVATYVSEGIDFFTPSDHGFRADFAPVISDMGLGNLIAATPSAEMTTQDYGHFNAWPTQIETFSPDSESPGLGQSTDPKSSQGSVDWGGTAPVGRDFPAYGNYSFAPQQIVAASKNDPVTPGREVVVQINHVEGHFGAAGLGIDTGQNPPVSSSDPASKRLDPAFDDPDPAIGPGNYYTDSYDSLELWIGTSGAGGQNLFLGENFGDWFNLINQGRFHTGVSNSDTHDRRITALHARNIISIPAALRTGSVVNPAAVAADPHTVGDSVLEGLTTMTNAPFVIIKARNAGGDVAGLELTDAFGPVSRPMPLAAPGETVNLDIDIQSPVWAEYDRISVYINGETVRVTDSTTGLPVTPPRYNVCDAGIQLNAPADFSVNRVTVPNTGGEERLESDLDNIMLPSPGQDYWFVVRIEGTQDVSRPMWPVVPNDFTDADGLDNRSPADRGVYALAVTNPIYVDANNNGSWDPPGVMTHMGTVLDPCP